MFVGFYPPWSHSSVPFSSRVSSYMSFKVNSGIVQQPAFTSTLNKIHLTFVHVLFVHCKMKHSVQVECIRREHTCRVPLISRKLNTGKTNINLKKTYATVEHHFPLSKRLKAKFQGIFQFSIFRIRIDIASNLPLSRLSRANLHYDL